MKIKTIKLDNSIKKSKKKTTLLEKIMLASLLLIQAFLNTFLPFMFGYYLYQTGHFIFLILLLILMFFNIQIEHTKDGEINIKVIKYV